MLKKKTPLLSVIIALSLISIMCVGNVYADTIYEYYNTGDDSYSYSQLKGQTFTTTSSHNITAVNLKIGRGGSGGSMYAYIYATDVNGLPTGSALTSGSIPADNVTAAEEGDWYTINVTPYTLSSNTKYAIVLYYNNGYVYWRLDWTSPTYAGGSALQYWGYWEEQTGRDFMFEVWG